MEHSLLIGILTAGIASGTPLLLAALGGIIGERSGVMNLGLEGFMLMGAVSSFAGTILTGEKWIGVIAALLVSAILGFLFALITVGAKANQVVCGLATVIFCTGLSTLIGQPFIGLRSPDQFAAVIPIPILHKIPWVGDVIFSQGLFAYIGMALVGVVWFALWRTRPGLHLRSVGENPAAADTLGINVPKTRYLCTIIGCALAGLGGASLALAFSPSWIENITAGRGWIAVAVIVFSGHKPLRALLGAYLFGCVQVMGFRLQAMGVNFPSYLMSMLPYFLPLLVLVITAARYKGKSVGLPAALGLPYYREAK